MYGLEVRCSILVTAPRASRKTLDFSVGMDGDHSCCHESEAWPVEAFGSTSSEEKKISRALTLSDDDLVFTSESKFLEPEFQQLWFLFVFLSYFLCCV